MKQENWRRNQKVVQRRNSILWLWFPVKFKFFYGEISVDEVKVTESTSDIIGREIIKCLDEKAKISREM